MLIQSIQTIIERSGIKIQITHKVPFHTTEIFPPPPRNIPPQHNTPSSKQHYKASSQTISSITRINTPKTPPSQSLLSNTTPRYPFLPVTHHNKSTSFCSLELHYKSKRDKTIKNCWLLAHKCYPEKCDDT